jgi:hypothetical protein
MVRIVARNKQKVKSTVSFELDKQKRGMDIVRCVVVE